MDDFQDAFFLAEEKKKKALTKKKQHDHAKRQIETLDQSIEHCDFASASASPIEKLFDNDPCPTTPHLDAHYYHIEDDIDVFYDEESDERIDSIGSNPIDSSNLNDDHDSAEEFDLVGQDRPLHLYTDIDCTKFSLNFLRLIRSTNICKSRAQEFLKLIKSALPDPNYLPDTMVKLLRYLDFDENLFTKRAVCTSCASDLPNVNATQCTKCKTNNASSRALIYDSNACVLLTLMIRRLRRSIQSYRNIILASKNSRVNTDIPFGLVYQRFLKQNNPHEFINLILHLDGVGLCKSSKLKLWLFSAAVVELPPALRYRRHNMVLLSMWVGTIEPEPHCWLRSCIDQLLVLKTTGIHVDENYKIRYFAVVGDCPALKLVLKFVNHQGYHCCFFCNIRGVHVHCHHKRQYYYEPMCNLRDTKSYAEQSMEAEVKRMNVNGHLGVSILHDLLDTPLPEAILIDYLHVSLLRHSKTIFSDLYRRLKPIQRETLDKQLHDQAVPHYFNRRLRPLRDLAYIKGSELRNNLFYAILPLLCNVLPIEMLAHLSLFICAIRIWHGEAIFSEKTSEIAGELFSYYYRDHELFYCGLQNFVLHIHSHFQKQHDNFGALSYTSTFAQEDLVGHVSANRHGSRYQGDLIAYYHSLDFALHNRMADPSDPVDGLFDQCINYDIRQYPQIEYMHSTVCHCSSLLDCVVIFRRCRLQQKIYHSLLYTKCKKSVSFFVQYGDVSRVEFGRIGLFFSCNNHMFALIHSHHRSAKFSEKFVSSTYYNLLKDPIDHYFFILKRESSTHMECVPINSIKTHCIIFEFRDSLVVTPVFAHYEHD